MGLLHYPAPHLYSTHNRSFNAGACARRTGRYHPPTISSPSTLRARVPVLPPPPPHNLVTREPHNLTRVSPTLLFIERAPHPITLNALTCTLPQSAHPSPCRGVSSRPPSSPPPTTGGARLRTFLHHCVRRRGSQGPSWPLWEGRTRVGGRSRRMKTAERRRRGGCRRRNASRCCSGTRELTLSLPLPPVLVLPQHSSLHHGNDHAREPDEHAREPSP